MDDSLNEKKMQWWWKVLMLCAEEPRKKSERKKGMVLNERPCLLLFSYGYLCTWLLDW